MMMSKYACFDFGQSLGGKPILQAEGKDKWASAKGITEKNVWGRSIGEDLEAKLESARDATRDGLSKARDSTESLYRDARSATERKADEARYAAESKKEEAKAGWFSWLGWGRSKVDEGKGKTEAEADRVKKEGAQKVADASESVKQRAEKHT